MAYSDPIQAIEQLEESFRAKNAELREIRADRDRLQAEVEQLRADINAMKRKFQREIVTGDVLMNDVCVENQRLRKALEEIESTCMFVCPTQIGTKARAALDGGKEGT